MTTTLDGLMASANRAHAENRLADAEKLCRTILAQVPNNAATLVLLGIVLTKRGDPKSAVSIFRQVIAADARCWPAYLWLSMTLRDLGDASEALAAASQAARLNPSDALGLHHLGLCHLDRAEFESAEGYFRKALSLAPQQALPHHSLGLALRGQMRDSEAAASFRQAVRRDPKFIASLIELRDVLMDLDDPSGAADVARKVVELESNSAEAKLWLARALALAGNEDESESLVDEARKLNPSSAIAHALLGSLLQVRGAIGDAEHHLIKSIELEPEQASAYVAFVTHRKMTAEDGDVIKTIERLATHRNISADSLCQLQYGLGKAHEDLGEFETAMKDYDAANKDAYRLKFGNRPFDRKAFQASYDRTIATFNSKLFSDLGSAVSTSDTPIFVVGMIRSGTTLAEQILSSHPEVGAAGELRFWLDNMAAALNAGGGLDLGLLGRLAAKYQAILNEHAPQMARVVDKMPMNYLALGVIHIAFPNAKIIHMKRNPVDTCLSIYATQNRARLTWANDKANIVYAYRQYLRLMDHWHEVLPKGTILDVNYESLVAQPEPSIRSLIDFCGLEWDERCLRPQENRRAVITPSLWQVRQPIYRTSVQRWKKFEPWLGPFRELMEEG